MATSISDSAAIDQLNAAIDARLAEKLAEMDRAFQAKLEQRQHRFSGILARGTARMSWCYPRMTFLFQ